MRYEKNKLEKLVNESNSYSEVVRKLGLKVFCGNRQTVKKYINLFKININHFGNYNCGSKIKDRIPLEKILIKNSTYIHTTTLKKKLYKFGIKERKCELCGQTELWNGKIMSLILDHINGINNDNRLENLRIVCPNCNATLETHCRGERRAKKYYCECGNTMANKKSKKCIICENKDDNRSKSQRIVERPKYEELLREIDEFGYSATGRKYGVSDNAIRKWIKFYNKNGFGA